MKHKGTIQIETENLFLRRFRLTDDLAMYNNWASDSLVTKYLTWPAHENVKITRFILNDWIKNYENLDFYQWAITLKSNGDEPIGNIGIVHKNEETGMVHVGYCIGQKWWHKGITSEALNAIIDFFITKVNANRVESRHDPVNSNSGKVMLKCGMKYEGTIRNGDINNTGICDYSIYGILAHEYILSDIPCYLKWKTIKKINKGFSRDIKYYIENDLNEKFILRLADSSLYESKRKEFENMKKIYKLGIPMSKPLSFGICCNDTYVYSILSWVDGTSCNETISSFSEKKQYELGIKAGQILKKIHSIKVPSRNEAFEKEMISKINTRIQKYRDSGIKIENDNFAIEYIYKNLHLIKDRPLVYQHGDFHPSNFVITPNNTLSIIDFNRWDYGDSYEEFNKLILFTSEHSIPFAIGQINGYFNDNPPEEFFKILSLYVAYIALFSVAWVIPFGETKLQEMIERTKRILNDYDNFNLTIPKWFNYDFMK